jgi:archaeal flagellar protein FlaI
MTIRTFPARAREFFTGCRSRFGTVLSRKIPLGSGEPGPAGERGTAPVLSEKNLYARMCSLPENMGDRTARGDLLIAASLGATFVTGYLALFAAIPIPAIAVSGMVSVAFMYLTAAALRCRACYGTPGAEPERTAPVSGPAGLSAGLCTIPSRMGSRTLPGDLLIVGSGAVAAGTGYVALFAYIPVGVIAVSGTISLVFLFLTAAAIRCRYRNIAPELSRRETIAKAPADVPPRQGTGPAPNPPLPIPETRTPATLDEYWVEAPYVYVKIVRRGDLGFTYTVVEPALSFRELVLLQETGARLRRVIVYDDPDHPPAKTLNRDLTDPVIREFSPEITDERLGILSYYLRRDLSGLGPLEPLMQDPALEDISCNGGDLPVFVFHRNYGSLPTSVRFSEEDLNQVVLRLAQKANKQISLTTPMVDATLPGGSRVQVTYSNVVSLRGSSFTIRKFRADPMTPLDLIRYGTYCPEILAFLWLVIEHRRSLIIAGGTASGKTSTMNAISLFIPLNAKIVSLEDTHEIQLPHSNWLATQTRELATPGTAGDIDLFALLKSSMRQRPEYIIVGEVRGREAQTLFQAMNTGHATLSTLHAGSVQEAINRLTHEPISVPPVMFTALDLVVNQSLSTYAGQRTRRCLAVHEISVDTGGNIVPHKLFEWDIRTDTFRRLPGPSRVLDEIAAMRGWTPEQVQAELSRREEFLTVALDVPTPEVHDLARAIHDLG